MSRSSAEITPIDSDCSSPNGDPIAATGDPTRRFWDDPSRSGVSLSPSASIFKRPTSAFRSVPTILAGTRLPSANSTKTFLARSNFGASPSTTWALVAT
jgi:hypothetical protein